MPPENAAFEVCEDHRLRRWLGLFFLLLSLPLLLAGYLVFGLPSYGPTSIIIFISGPASLVLSVLSFARTGTARVRLRLTRDGVWVLPDANHWNLLRRSYGPPTQIALSHLTKIEDGGGLYSYRRLTLTTVQGSHALNTTHLDTDLRSVVARLDTALEEHGLCLAEVGTGLRARTGHWTVQSRMAAR